eukprot:CAMPEP_0174694244 /NCGR_PEP_ID=MMETSP1094-20130205/854_1 /TAXON_ID=156173 /ORGANISM="Chrysochromulina brevifilum, Strain UTEX LB 985" /LENGTH=159 /DNA_ID=CAMNT_0015890413 /DNA_START=117 /DNA_END=598 /DNA_ORIENTATION=+
MAGRVEHTRSSRLARRADAQRPPRVRGPREEEVEAAAAVSTPSRARHELHKVVGASAVLDAAHHVLDITEAISAAEAQHGRATVLKGELLQVGIPASNPWKRPRRHVDAEELASRLPEDKVCMAADAPGAAYVKLPPAARVEKGGSISGSTTGAAARLE